MLGFYKKAMLFPLLICNKAGMIVSQTFQTLYYYTKLQMQTKTKVLKFGLATILGAGLAGAIYAQISIPTNIDNSVITVKKINITEDNNADSSKVVIDANASDENFLKVQ